MKNYTFYTTRGKFSSVQLNMKDAFEDVCINCPELTLAHVTSGTIERLDAISIAA